MKTLNISTTNCILTFCTFPQCFNYLSYPHSNQQCNVRFILSIDSRVKRKKLIESEKSKIGKWTSSPVMSNLNLSYCES